MIPGKPYGDAGRPASILVVDDTTANLQVLMVRDELRAIRATPRVSVVSVSFLILLWSASNASVAVMQSTNAAYGEEAVALAQRMPFQAGDVDVRPLFELTDFPVDPNEQPGGWRENEVGTFAAFRIW